MPNRDYTRKERDTINGAYSRLAYWCDCHTDYGHKLADALSYERKGRSSVTIAKAVLVESATDDKLSATTPAMLCRWSRGCATAAMLGHLMQTEDPKLWAELKAAADAAKTANRAATSRAIDAIFAD